MDTSFAIFSEYPIAQKYPTVASIKPLMIPYDAPFLFPYIRVNKFNTSFSTIRLRPTGNESPHFPGSWDDIHKASFLTP